MNNRILLIELYDYYGELLTEKQKEYFEGYYFDNLSLSEMSENYQISRNAIHKQLKEVETKLSEYESTLALQKKAKEIKQLLKGIPDAELAKKIEELI